MVSIGGDWSSRKNLNENEKDLGIYFWRVLKKKMGEEHKDTEKLLEKDRDDLVEKENGNKKKKIGNF